MSFYRLIFYHAILGGWAAFAGWLVSELALLRRRPAEDTLQIAITTALVGAAIGGLLGSLCFVLIARNVSGNMPGRAIGFVILGACIGLFIGLAQIIMREAWLTVEQGFRPGRQVVLNVPVTILGTSEKAQLPFI